MLNAVVFLHSVHLPDLDDHPDETVPIDDDDEKEKEDAEQKGEPDKEQAKRRPRREHANTRGVARPETGESRLCVNTRVLVSCAILA